VRDADVAAFARQWLGAAPDLDAAETRQAADAANEAVTADAGTRAVWSSARHRGYAEAVGALYRKRIWHCLVPATGTTYRDSIPCRRDDREVAEAEYWRLSGRAAPAALAQAASIAPPPRLQPCRTINEVTEVGAGRLTVMREHCLPLPSGPEPE
jgi:hypothetical protein